MPQKCTNTGHVCERANSHNHLLAVKVKARLLLGKQTARLKMLSDRDNKAASDEATGYFG